MDIKFLVAACIYSLGFSFGAAFLVRNRGLAFLAIFLLVSVGFASFLTYAYFGIGHTWDTTSSIGKAASLILSVSTPLLLATVPIGLLLKSKISSSVALFLSALAGMIGVALLPVVGVILACVFTGDCL